MSDIPARLDTIAAWLQQPEDELLYTPDPSPPDAVLPMLGRVMTVHADGRLSVRLGDGPWVG